MTRRHRIGGAPGSFKVKRVIRSLATLLPLSASPALADAVAPPPAAPLLLKAEADGVQIYDCEAKGQRFEWLFTAPEANLFDADRRQIGTHFAGPTWKLNDGSSVIGEVLAKADAPQPGAVPWLLLRAKRHEGRGALVQVEFIRRSETTGGAAPSSGCDADHVGLHVRIRYSATYEFFGPAK
jgi:hypothetical protein